MIDTLYPPTAQCLPIGILTLRVLGDLQRWAATELPDHRDVPFAVLALSESIALPWSEPGQLRLSGRLAVWICAADDYVEQDVTELGELDDFIARCDAVVRTGRHDAGHPLLACLSGWQSDLAAQPLYPALAQLWQRMFTAWLSAMRYDWVTGQARADGADVKSTVDEYLANADSISVWQVQLSRWVASGCAELVDHLDVLVPALEDGKVACRLANDLASYARERTDPRENNVLMYGVSPDWVHTQIDNRVAAVRERLAGLVAKDFRPAVGLLRMVEWSVGIYARADVRVSAV